MDTIANQLDAWLASLQDKRPGNWEQLPDIGLYMDQVLTYVDRQLSLYRRSDKEHVLTPAMINNYIKDNLLPRADMKKYAPNHLAILTMIGALKQVFSMQDLQILLGGLEGPEQARAFYLCFLNGQNRVVSQTAGQVAHQVSSTLENVTEVAQTERQLRELALDLAIEARVRILISEQILTLLAQNQLTKREKSAAAVMVTKAAKVAKVKNKKTKPTAD